MPSKRLCILAALVACAGCFDLTESIRKDPTSDAGADATNLPDSSAPADPCRGVICDEPPLRSCKGANVMLVPEQRGYCVNENGKAQCVHPNHQENCLEGSCVDGNCSNVPCQAVRCDEPPAPTCSGSNLIVHYPMGQCESTGGQTECSYNSQTIPCSLGCQDGACTGEPCASVVCNRPPARYCAGDSLVLWGDTGRCSDDGACTYASDVVPCSTGCANGRCIEEDPCAHTTCTAPPASFCLDASTLVAFTSNGTCAEGSCSYESTSIPCAGGCEGGKCTGDPCAGIECKVPPAPACDGDGLKVWAYGWGPAQCENGGCQFPLETIPCGAAGCKHGACVSDPCMAMQAYCSGLTPPADHCVEERAVTFNSVGACYGSGVCRYESYEEGCAGGCVAGSCQ
jgi:hypothetical protein